MAEQRELLEIIERSDVLLTDRAVISIFDVADVIVDWRIARRALSNGDIRLTLRDAECAGFADAITALCDVARRAITYEPPLIALTAVIMQTVYNAAALTANASTALRTLVLALDVPAAARNGHDRAVILSVIAQTVRDADNASAFMCSDSGSALVRYLFSDDDADADDGRADEHFWRALIITSLLVHCALPFEVLDNAYALDLLCELDAAVLSRDVSAGEFIGINAAAIVDVIDKGLSRQETDGFAVIDSAVTALRHIIHAVRDAAPMPTNRAMQQRNAHRTMCALLQTTDALSGGRASTLASTGDGAGDAVVPFELQTSALDILVALTVADAAVADSAEVLRVFHSHLHINMHQPLIREYSVVGLAHMLKTSTASRHEWSAMEITDIQPETEMFLRRNGIEVTFDAQRKIHLKKRTVDTTTTQQDDESDDDFM